jgi:uncharacterized protein YkwD
MIRGLLWLVFSFYPLLSFSQYWEQKDYKRYNYKNFKEAEIFNKSIDFSKIDYALLNAAIFYETNLQRVNNKQDILQYHPLLEKASMIHARSMSEHDFFAHNNPVEEKYKTPDDRGEVAGITNPYIAENIANQPVLDYVTGQRMQVIDAAKGKFRNPESGELIVPHTYLSFAEKVVDGWMHSPPHKKNILSEKALQLGCGTNGYEDKKNLNLVMINIVQNFQLFEKVNDEK